MLPGRVPRRRATVPVAFSVTGRVTTQPLRFAAAVSARAIPVRHRASISRRCRGVDSAAATAPRVRRWRGAAVDPSIATHARRRRLPNERPVATVLMPALLPRILVSPVLVLAVIAFWWWPLPVIVPSAGLLAPAPPVELLSGAATPAGFTAVRELPRIPRCIPRVPRIPRWIPRIPRISRIPRILLATIPADRLRVRALAAAAMVRGALLLSQAPRRAD
mmetsp:Transcript_29768/g.81608  ORF Transcript_29768/g.81608 Transcript_29768/m.81608 type:complete len:220 (-) Transcript_29768:1471-2130(-)